MGCGSFVVRKYDRALAGLGPAGDKVDNLGHRGVEASAAALRGGGITPGGDRCDLRQLGSASTSLGSAYSDRRKLRRSGLSAARFVDVVWSGP
jgi:hypothetical protein